MFQKTILLAVHSRFWRQITRIAVNDQVLGVSAAMGWYIDMLAQASKFHNISERTNIVIGGRVHMKVIVAAQYKRARGDSYSFK